MLGADSTDFAQRVLSAVQFADISGIDRLICGTNRPDYVTTSFEQTTC